MDPKQTEGQKSGPMPQAQGGFSFQTGQLNPAASAPSALGATSANTLSTGANIARTMNDLNMGDRKSATSNSPFAKHHFNKVAPQTGDIIIEQSDKKSNGLFFKKVKNPAGSTTGEGLNRGRLIQFGLIFGGIALVGLVIFAVVMLINQPKKSDNSSSSETATSSDYQSAFNRYANWMISGEESEEDIKNISLNNYYVNKMLTGKKDELIAYLETAKSYYDDFRTAYDASDLANYTSLSSTVASTQADLSFYIGYLQTASFSDVDFLELYLKDKENFQSNLSTVYTELGNQSPSATVFADEGEALATLLNVWFIALDDNNCLAGDTINEICENQLVASNQDILDTFNSIANLKKNMNGEVVTTINRVILYIGVINRELSSPTESEEYSEETNEETSEGEPEDTAKTEGEQAQ